MGVYAGPDVSESGLVLALDGANYKSFKGEPTTNVVTNTNLDTGWSKGYNTSIQWNDYPPPDNVDSQVVSFVDSDGNGSGYWYSYGDYAPQDPNITYTISVYARTIGSDWTIQAYTANNSETGRQFTNTVTIPGDGKWHRAVFNSITTPANTESDSLSFYFPSIPAGQRCWLCAPQMEAKSYATTFTTGTRGTTVATGGGWANMSGNGNHGQLVNGVRESDDNLGSLDFDGTDDYVTAGALSGSFASFTVIIWFYPTSVTDFENPIDCNYSYNGTTGNIGPRLEIDSSGNLGWYYSNITNDNNIKYSHDVVSSGLAANTWHYAAITYDGETNTSTTYYNGNATGLPRGGSATGFVGVMNNITIGKGFHVGGAERIFTGRVSSVSIYNRALSAQEIQQNFNATRSRYGV